MNAKDAKFEDGNNVHIHFTDNCFIGLSLDIEHFKEWLDNIDSKDFYHLNDEDGNANFTINKKKILFVNYKV